jgi:hypothetical protein
MEKTKSDPGPGYYVTKRRNEPEPGRGRGGGQRAWGMWAGRRMRARSGRGRVDVGAGGVGAGDGWRQSTGQRRRGVRVCEFRAPGGVSGGLFVRLVDFLFSKFFPECLPLALGEDFVFFPTISSSRAGPLHLGKGPLPRVPLLWHSRKDLFRPECLRWHSGNYFFIFLPHFLWGLPTLFKLLAQFWPNFDFFVIFR